MQKRSVFLPLAIAATTLSLGCTMTNENAPSNDIAELSKKVQLDLVTKSARWEIFATPEYTGGVPGPTYIVTLVAEVDLLDEKTITDRPGTGTVSIAPEAARSWLNEPFRSMLAKNRNRRVDLSITYNCRRFEGVLKENQERVKGFICNGSGKSLVYLTLWEEPM